MDNSFYNNKIYQNNNSFSDVDISNKLPLQHSRVKDQGLFGNDISNDNELSPFKNLKKEKFQIDYSDSIVDLGEEANNVPFELFQDIHKQADFTNSINNIQEQSILGAVFFSRKNINNIQFTIKKDVNVLLKDTDGTQKYQIGNQSESELQIIMRSIYLQHSKNLNTNIQKQVGILNRLVVQYCVDNIIVNVKQYLNYIQFINGEKKVLPRSQSTNIKGDKNSYDLSDIQLFGNI